MNGEKGSKKCGYFELSIYGKYSKQYWLLIEIRDDATLKDLDSFLRDIWVECCGHLSSFEIEGVSYDVTPDEDSFWGEPAENMNHKLKTVLETGMKFSYEYDFGSTTELMIEVCGYREGFRKREKLTLLSRNNPPEYLCDECGERKATAICTSACMTAAVFYAMNAGKRMTAARRCSCQFVILRALASAVIPEAKNIRISLCRIVTAASKVLP